MKPAGSQAYKGAIAPAWAGPPIGVSKVVAGDGLGIQIRIQIVTHTHIRKYLDIHMSTHIGVTHICLYIYIYTHEYIYIYTYL